MNLNDNARTQVVIIGAGPTGLSMAAQLIRHNIDFILIDKNEQTTTLSKALVVHARTLEIFKELHLAEKAIDEGQITKCINLIRNGKKKARIDISNLGEGLSEFPFALSLEQSKTEKLLYNFLLQHQKQVVWQSEFISLTQNENEVIVAYKEKDGSEKKIQAQYLVGCDGAHSLVRHQLELSFEGDTEPKLFYVADVIIKSDLINKKELYFFLTQKAFILFFAMEGDMHYRIVGVLADANNVDRNLSFEDVRDSIKSDVGCELEFEELKWFSGYKIHSRKANAFAKDRCFICGDAAHIHTPAGGQGMNTGIQDAYNLAWKLAFVLKYHAKEDVLNSAKKKFFPLVSQTGIAYYNSSLTIESSVSNIKAGERMPYFKIENKSVFDFLMKPFFKILCFGTNVIQKDFFAIDDMLFEIHHFKNAPAPIFKNETNFYILLRPDNHISYIGKEIKTCKDFLEEYFVKC